MPDNLTLNSTIAPRRLGSGDLTFSLDAADRTIDIETSCRCGDYYCEAERAYTITQADAQRLLEWLRECLQQTREHADDAINSASITIAFSDNTAGCPTGTARTCVR